MNREKDEKEVEHVAETDEVIAELKASVDVAVWEAKIKHTEDLKNVGSWNVVDGMRPWAS